MTIIKKGSIKGENIEIDILYVKAICNNCGNEQLKHKKYKTVCSKCGNVIEESKKIDK